MRRLLIPLGIAILLGIVAAAFAWDCVRAARGIEEGIVLVDADLMVQEERLVQAIAGWINAPSEVTESIKRYRDSKRRADRHASFDQLVESINKALSGASAGPNPPSTEVKDNIAGAINRRNIAVRRYREEESLQLQWDSTFRGTVAKAIIGPRP